MNVRGGTKNRRWRWAIAIIAALGVFTAVTTGWATGGSGVTAATLAPHTVTLSQANQGVGVDLTNPQADARSQPGNASVTGTPTGSSPTHTKNHWMTRDRPQTWNRTVSQTARAALPASFTASELQPVDTQARALEAAPTDHDILTQLCLARC